MRRLDRRIGAHHSADRGLIAGPSYEPDEASFVLAALYTRDALNGRLDNGHAAMWYRPAHVRRLFILHTSAFWNTLVFTSCTLHVLLFFGEPAVTLPATLRSAGWGTGDYGWSTSTSGADARWAHTLVGALDVACTCVLIVDVSIKIAFIGFDKWRRRPTHKIYATFILSLILDDVLFLAGAGRPLRSLRCGVMLVRSRTLRKNVAAILAIWKVLVSCTLVLLLLLLLCASTAVHLFSSSYLPSALPPPPPPMPAVPGGLSYPAAPFDASSLYSSSFYALAWGLSAAFQLLTTENYPDVGFMPAADAPAAMAFFIVWWYLISFIVLAIVTAVIVDSYWAVSKRQIMAEGRREKLGLMRAFELLHKKRGHFGMRVWEKFLKELMPSASVTEARVRFAMLDLDQNGQVDALEFLQIRAQLEMELHELPQGGVPPQRTQSRLSWINPVSRNGPLIRICRCLLSAAASIDVRWYTLIDMAVSLGQFILLLLVHPETDAARAKVLADVSLGLAAVSALILGVRAALHARVSTWRTFLLDWSHTADVLVVLFAIACYITIYASGVPGLHPATGRSPYDWAFVPQLLLAVRLTWTTPYTKRFLPLMLRIAPILWWITILIVLVMSFFSVLGAELFATCEQADTDLQPNSDLYAGHTSYFARYHLALLTNVQLLVTNDWHRVMYATQTAVCSPAGATRSILAQVYFIGVYLIYQIVLYPVLIALATNAYMHFSAMTTQNGDPRELTRSNSVRVEFLKREPNTRNSRAGEVEASDSRTSLKVLGGAMGRSSAGSHAGRGSIPYERSSQARPPALQTGASVGGEDMETISEDTSSCPARDRRSCVGARVIKPPRQQTSPRQAPAVSWFGRWSLSPDTRRTPGSACSLKSAKSGERCGSCASDCDEGLSPAHGRSSCPANLDETAASCGSTCGAPNGAVVQSTSASPNALRGPRAHRDVNSMGSRSASPGARRCSHHNSITFAEQPTSPSRASRVSRASRGSSQYPGGGAGPGDAAGKSSCFYVHMLKTNHYRAGGWRRDIMRNEMSEIGEAELHDLSAAAQAAHLQMVQEWQQRRDKSVARFSGSSSLMRSDAKSRWGRAARWVSGGVRISAQLKHTSQESVPSPGSPGVSTEVGQPLPRVSDATSAAASGSLTRWARSPNMRVGEESSDRDEIRKLLNGASGKRVMTAAVEVAEPAAVAAAVTAWGPHKRDVPPLPSVQIPAGSSGARAWASPVPMGKDGRPMALGDTAPGAARSQQHSASAATSGPKDPDSLMDAPLVAEATPTARSADGVGSSIKRLPQRSNTGFRFPGIEQAVLSAQRSAAKVASKEQNPSPSGCAWPLKAASSGIVSDSSDKEAPPPPLRKATGSSLGSTKALRRLASALLRPLAGGGLHEESDSAVERSQGRLGAFGLPLRAGASGGSNNRAAAAAATKLGAAELWDRLRMMTSEERESVFATEDSLGGAAWDELVASFEQAELVGKFMLNRKDVSEAVVLFNDLTDDSHLSVGVQDGQMLVVPHFTYEEAEEAAAAAEEEEEGDEECDGPEIPHKWGKVSAGPVCARGGSPTRSISPQLNRQKKKAARKPQVVPFPIGEGSEGAAIEKPKS